MKHAAAVAELLSYQAYMVRMRSSRSPYCMYACHPSNVSVRLSVRAERDCATVQEADSAAPIAADGRHRCAPMHCIHPDLT